jgi:nucleoside-diphosphate-sugar epimerase
MPFSSLSIVGLGWLGEPLAKHLLENKYTVKGSTTNTEKLERLKQEGIETFLFDANISENKEELSKLFDAEVIIITIPPKLNTSNLLEYQHKIKNIIQQINTEKTQLVIYTSSTSVYSQKSGFYNENALLDSNDNAIIAAEKLLQEKFKEKLVILRLSGLCGPKRNLPEFFIKSNRTPDNPELCVNMVHQKDLINAIFSIIKNPYKSDKKIFNISADFHPLRRDFYKSVYLSNKTSFPKINFNTQNIRLIDNSLFKKEFDFEYEFKDPLLFTY